MIRCLAPCLVLAGLLAGCGSDSKSDDRIARQVDETRRSFAQDRRGEEIPTGPVTGTIGGAEVELPNATYDGMVLALHTGPRWSTPSLIFFFLAEDDSMEGLEKRFSADAERDFSVQMPHIHMRWHDEEGDSQVEIAMDGYDLELTTGEAVDGRIDGWIRLAMPEKGVRIAGAFSFDARARN